MDGFVYCVFDLESTGLRVESNRVLSVAASCRGKEFSSFVNPCMRIPHEATKVNGISDDDVKNEPKWDVVGPRLWAWLEERRIEADAHTVVLVAHNCSFDAKFLRMEMARLPFVPPGPPKLEAVDTLKISRSRLKLIPRHRQSDVYQHLFQEQPKDQHSAIGDVAALTRICEHPTFARALPLFRVPLRFDFPLAAQLPFAFPIANQNPIPISVQQHQPPIKTAITAQQHQPQIETAIAQQQTPIGGTAKKCGSCGVVFSTFFEHACAGS